MAGSSACRTRSCGGARRCRAPGRSRGRAASRSARGPCTCPWRAASRWPSLMRGPRPPRAAPRAGQGAPRTSPGPSGALPPDFNGEPPGLAARVGDGDLVVLAGAQVELLLDLDLAGAELDGADLRAVAARLDGDPAALERDDRWAAVDLQRGAELDRRAVVGREAAEHGL